jgi:hypothetical protein
MKMANTIADEVPSRVVGSSAAMRQESLQKSRLHELVTELKKLSKLNELERQTAPNLCFLAKGGGHPVSTD